MLRGVCLVSSLVAQAPAAMLILQEIMQNTKNALAAVVATEHSRGGLPHGHGVVHLPAVAPGGSRSTMQHEGEG